jgi:hypothetical protein
VSEGGSSLVTSSTVPRVALGPSPTELVTVVLRIAEAEAGLVTTHCPQCGVNPAGPPEPQQWRYVPPWVYVMLGLGMGWLALLAYFAARQTVTSSLMLCADCASTAKRSKRLRSISVVGMVAFPLLFGAVGGVVVDGMGALYGSMIGMVSGIAGMIAVHRRTRSSLVHCKHIDKANGMVTLQLSPACEDVLRSETDVLKE